MDIAIVGAGIVGTSSAFFLARDGHRVTLIDPLPPGCGTSFGNAGILSFAHVLPVAHPGVVRALPRLLLRRDSPLRIRWAYLPRLAPWLLRFVLAARPARVEELAVQLRALVARAEAAHELVIESCGLGRLVHRTGWLKVARDERTLLAETAAERHWLERFSVPFELVAGARLRELEPALAEGVGAGLFLLPDRHVRNPVDYTRGIFAKVEEMGGSWRQATVRRWRTRGDRVLAAITDSGEEIGADLFVLAAGVFSRPLARRLGVRVPLEAERGYHVTLPYPEGRPRPRRPVLTVEDGYVLAPMRDGVRLTTGIELASPTAAPDLAYPRRLAEGARRWIAGIEPRILSEWIGYRPCLPDSLPCLGFSPRQGNVIFAFGHHHLGLTLGPVTGRIVADLVAGRDPGLDLAPYRADRRFF